ncbi:RNA polymerase sigma-70 factor [Mucilaginibacter sp. PPCGB 2223]|uniref:RNA polymerase sigma-70 factor n=1 Tax=Mucilaginibacter sp. PPCGB 2223 TaxID=1886027 RepID=UPI0009F269DC|nr:RNA polymerase sigma-70 factor [Mucilaginibacter sp. PPCGB 2223]
MAEKQANPLFPSQVALDEAMELLFSDIFRSHENALYTLAFRLTKDDALAKDIIQEVFIKLWDLRHTISEIENIDAFLFKLTRNKVMDFLRKTAADERLKMAIWEGMSQTLDQPASGLEQKEYHIVIAKAIAALPPKRREIYRLKMDEGLNYQQIADELNISRHTVKHQVSFALQSVRAFILSSFKLF